MINELGASRVFATLLREPTFQDAFVYLSTAQSEKHLNAMRRYVKEGNPTEAAKSEACAFEWEHLLNEIERLVRKYEVGE